MEDYWPAIMSGGFAIIGGLLIWAVGNLKKYVEKTPTKLDDEAYERLQKAITDAFNPPEQK